MRRRSKSAGVLATCVAVVALGAWGQAQQSVKSSIRFTPKGSGCVSVKEAVVRARSNNVVQWEVTADPACKFERQTVAIAFTRGGDPGTCHCSADLNNNAARLTLTVSPHTQHRTYDYEIFVAGRRIADPKLEVDP